MTVIVAVVVGVAVFYGGIQYQKSQTTNVANGQYAQDGQRQGSRIGAGRGRFGGATMGNVLSQDANSITIQLPDGSSKIINISGSTTFSKTDSASKSDIQNGMRIAAFGTNNSDGSVAAQNIQVNPPMGMRAGNKGGQSSPQPTQ